MVKSMSEPEWESTVVLNRSLLDERTWVPLLDPRQAGPLRSVKRWAMAGIPQQKNIRWDTRDEDTLVLQTKEKP